MLSHAQAPTLRRLLSWYTPDAAELDVDPDVSGEQGSTDWTDEQAAAFADETARALEVLAGVSDDEEAGQYLGMQCWRPAGDTWTGWLAYLREHILEHYALHLPQPHDRDGTYPQRISRFVDEATANRAATAVLRAHEGRLRQWSETDDGSRRLHLYADLGETVGHYLSHAEVEAYEDSGRNPALTPPRHEASGCVVLMSRHRDTGQPFVATAYPELTLPTDPRERYPDLTLLMGGFFNQDYPTLYGNKWTAEADLNFHTAPRIRERMIAQLLELLTEDDDALRRSVEALGSYVLPVKPRMLRRWVTGLHRRMTRLQWRPERW